MGLLTFPFRAPFKPLQGFIRLAGAIGEKAERELNDPVRIRRELEEAERRRAAGEISDEEFAEFEAEITRRLVPGRTRAATTADDDRS